jgi:hypothetical protein
MAEPRRCPHCEEPIEPTDLSAPIMCDGKLAQMHWECRTRLLIGSVGHQERTCCCYGGTESDPPGMTARQAARAANEHFNRGNFRGWPPRQSLN